jgi:high-affinity Fe2+/Pb2+ permease
MERRRQPHTKPNLEGIGAAIGAVLAAVLYCYLIAFEPGGFTVPNWVGGVMIMVGVFLGSILSWLFSRLR